MRRILASLVFFLVGSVMVVSGQDSAPNLLLIVDRDLSLTVYVASNVSLPLNGLAFRVRNTQGVFQTFRLEDRFESLQLTGGLAPPGSCYVYMRSGTSPVLPSVCNQPTRVYRIEVAPSDVFWYNFTENRPRDIAIVANGVPTGFVCPAALPECELTYIAPVVPTATVVPTNIAPSTPLPIVSVLSPVAHNDDWTEVSSNFGGVDMVLVPPGCFMMGSSGEGGQQCFDTPFWIARTETTNAQYRQCVDAEACTAPTSISYSDPAYTDYPVFSVSWFQAVTYAMWLGGRLPTEAEWEYAARGPDQWMYPWGLEFEGEKVVYGRNSGNRLAPVGSRPAGASWVGALDLSGNIFEWTSSLFWPYPYNKNDGRENDDDTSSLRVLRGGDYGYYNESRLSTVYRLEGRPSTASSGRGFRIARDFRPGDLP